MCAWYFHNLCGAGNVAHQLFHKPTQTRTDIWVELIGSPVLLLATQAFIMFATYNLMGLAFPEAAGRWATIPIIAQVALLLVFDDMAQY